MIFYHTCLHVRHVLVRLERRARQIDDGRDRRRRRVPSGDGLLFLEERGNDGRRDGEPEGGEREAPLVGEDGALRLQPPVELLLAWQSIGSE